MARTPRASILANACLKCSRTTRLHLPQFLSGPDYRGIILFLCKIALAFKSFLHCCFFRGATILPNTSIVPTVWLQGLTKYKYQLTKFSDWEIRITINCISRWRIQGPEKLHSLPKVIRNWVAQQGFELRWSGFSTHPSPLPPLNWQLPSAVCKIKGSWGKSS